MTAADVALFLKRALLTAMVEQGIGLSAHTYHESSVQTLVFTASDLWSPLPERVLPIIASRVQRLATGQLSYMCMLFPRYREPYVQSVGGGKDAFLTPYRLWR
jgi:hypothetical protein